MTDPLPFRPGKLLIYGQTLVRAAVRPNKTKNHQQWVIDITGPIPTKKSPHKARFAVISDFHHIQDGRLVGLTFVYLVRLPPRVDPEDVGVEQLRSAILSLFSDLIWSAVRTTAVQLAALAEIDGFKLPKSPPVPDTSPDVDDESKGIVDESSPIVTGEG